MNEALPDQHQNSWQLTAIQLSGWTSLPILATSIFILQGNSFLGAVFTIIVGNAILWFLRLAILSMSYEKRQSTLDISKEYLGEYGGYFIAFLLIFSTLAWFITQTTTAGDALTNLISIQENPKIDQFTQVSVLVGIISAFLCMEGIILLRRLCTIAFPLILVALLVSLFFLPSMDYHTKYKTSLYGLTLVLTTNLGITSDLPTFFRHSGSWRTSIKALTFVQLASLVLGICGLFFASVFSHTFLLNSTAVLNGSEILRIALIIFVFASVICANVANVYSASVGWEVVAPKALVGRKEYLIMGLGLTAIYVLVSNLFSMQLLLDITDSSLVNLCMILILGYVLNRVSGSSITPADRVVYFSGWFVSTLINSLQYGEILKLPISPFTVGLIVVALVLLSRMKKLFIRVR